MLSVTDSHAVNNPPYQTMRLFLIAEGKGKVVTGSPCPLF